ncbi:hypothetical protein V8G54_017327, partial [Vigna mungo]
PLNHLHKFTIAFPVILQGFFSFHQTPPSIHHHSFNSCTLQSHQTSIHRSRLIQSPPHCYSVQWQHHKHRHSHRIIMTMTNQRRVKLLSFLVFHRHLGVEVVAVVVSCDMCLLHGTLGSETERLVYFRFSEVRNFCVNVFFGFWESGFFLVDEGNRRTKC